MDDAYRRQGMVPPQREPCRSPPGSARRCSMPRRARQRNVIVRPHGPGVTFIQLDDLKAAQPAPARPRRVSHARNLARKFSGVGGARRIRRQGFCAPAAQRHRRRRDRERRHARRRQPQLQGQVRAPLSRASRSVRRNPAASRPPPSSKGSGLSRSRKLSRRRCASRPARVSPGGRKWPSYARCVDGAPLNSEETGPTSAAPISCCCMTAITWGWTSQEAARRLHGRKHQGTRQRPGLCRAHRAQTLRPRSSGGASSRNGRQQRVAYGRP